jgi:NADH-quinone oxidoreductase subunit J
MPHLNPVQVIAGSAVLLALGLWLLLPRGNAGGRFFGWLLTLAGLALVGTVAWKLGTWGAQGLFWVLSAITLIASVATIMFRSPVYCAVWFGLSLVGTAGLLLFQGAQFLAVATIVVYAGAILVTFLFVLMLAQSTGRAYYDRLSWEPFMSAVTGAVLVGILTTALVGASLGRAPVTSRADLEANILADDHVAHLGAELFSRYLLGVELAGTLLLVALVGTIAMVSHEAVPRPKGHGESGRALEAGSNPRGRPTTLPASPPKEPAHG